MSKGKERKFNGVWDARRVLYNVLFYADEEGRLKYVAGDAESTEIGTGDWYLFHIRTVPIFLQHF